MLDVALLGTGGMMPLPYRHLSSMICRFNGSMLLLDCGEATQISAKLLGWGFKNIDIILFTHFHADHISGLPGMLLAIGNSGRTEPLYIVGPKDLKRVVNALRVITPELPFEIVYKEICFNGLVDEIVTEQVGEYVISCCRLSHGITCHAYSLDFKRQGRFDVNKALKLGLPKQFWGKLQNGESAVYNDQLYTSEDVLGPQRKGIKLSYCTDTRPVSVLHKLIKDSDLFICEGLYGGEDKFEKCLSHKHMLYREAAEIAKNGSVSELWLTHFSPAVTDPYEFLDNATKIFENTKIGRDRMNTVIKFED